MKKAKELFIWLASFLVIFSVLFYINNGQVSGEDNEGWSELNQKSDTILQYVKQQHYEEAAQILEGFSEEFLQLLEEEKLTMKELQVITMTYDDALQAVKSASLPHEKRVQLVYELRLLMDVYMKHEAPLWKNMDQPLLSSLEKLRISAEAEPEQLVGKLQAFVGHYQTVQPALSIAVEQTNFQILQSQIQYLISMSHEPIEPSKWNDHLDKIETQLLLVFADESSSAADPSLYWVIITITSAVLSTLSYVGWRKYRAYKSEAAIKVEKRRDREL